MNSDEERPEPQYHYVIVRRDMEPGTQMAQAIHAAGETAHWGATHVGAAGESLRLRFDARAVALAARDEAELGNVVRVLRNHDRLHFIVRWAARRPDHRHRRRAGPKAGVPAVAPPRPLTYATLREAVALMKLIDAQRIISARYEGIGADAVLALHALVHFAVVAQRKSSGL